MSYRLPATGAAGGFGLCASVGDAGELGERRGVRSPSRSGGDGSTLGRDSRHGVVGRQDG